MSEEKKYMGSLFNTINYQSIEDLDKFITGMKRDHALYCLVQAVRYAYEKQVYSMEEGEVVSKSLRILTSPPEDDKPNLEEPEVYQA